VSSIRNDPSPAHESRMMQVQNDLIQLLGLMDDILVEVYSPNHESMRHLFADNESNDDHITCDFCDADIFQSFFECQECVPLNNEEESVLGGGLAICPGCYSEGRTCKCGSMKALQCRPFGTLAEDRDRAARALRNFDAQKRNRKLDTDYVQKYVHFLHMPAPCSCRLEAYSVERVGSLQSCMPASTVSKFN
jgi:hypothetical protein